MDVPQDLESAEDIDIIFDIHATSSSNSLVIYSKSLKVFYYANWNANTDTFTFFKVSTPYRQALPSNSIIKHFEFAQGNFLFIDQDPKDSSLTLTEVQDTWTIFSMALQDSAVDDISIVATPITTYLNSNFNQVPFRLILMKSNINQKEELKYLAYVPYSKLLLLPDEGPVRLNQIAAEEEISAFCKINTPFTEKEYYN